MDELSAPLDVLAPPAPLPRRLLRGMLVIAVLPLLPLLIVLLPLVALAGVPMLAIFRPALLRGLPRDVRFVIRLVSATRQLNQRLTKSRGTFTTADYWAETVCKHSAKTALVFGERTYTYAQVDAESDRVARWALDQRLAPGDAVALLCSNRPEHLFCWLGLTKVGVAATLLNTSLRGNSLRHALRQCKVSTVLFDATASAVLAPLAAAPLAAAATTTGLPADAAKDDDALEPAEGEEPPLRFVCLDAAATPPFASPLELPATAAAVDVAVRAGCRSSDTLLHIFTSGTTGLPKAARLNHIRFFSAIVLPYLFELKASDRLYCCLPMCHTAAIGSLSICWWLGIPLILAPRFSASTFWSECAEHGATVVQYVGELCRFLLATPPSPHDRKHRVRLALGNGMRPDVWPRFKARFGIERVAELYASTEGNANLANTEGKEGAVGFISPLLAPVYPVRLIRLADSSAAGGEIARGPKGLALLCGAGEAGELLGLVNQRDAARNFAGYTDVAATRRKLVRNVLKRGDCWFRTGDLMRTDGEGFVYFVDRLGDTFRYKGENVSTAEVAAAIGAIGPLRLAQCVVYGVQLPQVDGRVGMAALLVEEGAPPPSMATLFAETAAQLPPYAQPRFVRLLSSAAEIATTITFKPRTAALQAEGCDPAKMAHVYLRDAAAHTYVPLDAETYTAIVAGTRPLG